MKKKTINPQTLFNSKQFGFSQVAISDPGRIVFISGQVAWDENLNVSGINDLAGQTRKSLDNLEIAIREAGGNLSDIVMLRI
ncbi:MAG: RidA family protein, partial [Saprospiraceae bacterium]|nr:RidA family protein [Saprospiraceae bacterium]